MRALLLTGLLLVAPAALAQPERAAGGDPVEALAAALDLDDDQADLVAELLDPEDPGASWTLAAELLPTLTDAQRETLFATPERPEGARRGRGMRGGRGARARGRRGQGEGPGGLRQPDPARVAVQRAARNAALALTDEQIEQFDAYEEARREAGIQSLRDPEARAQARADLEAILTPEQVEVVDARQAIQQQIRRSMRQARRGDA